MELRIALVEQHGPAGHGTAARLRAAGYKVRQVDSPDDAAVLLEQSRVDLVLLDLGSFDTLAFIKVVRRQWPELTHRLAAITLLPDTLARFCPEITVIPAGSDASALSQYIDRTLVGGYRPWAESPLETGHCQLQLATA